MNILIVSAQANDNTRTWADNNEEHFIRIAAADEAAIELMHPHDFDIVLVHEEDAVVNYDKIKAVAGILMPDSILLKVNSIDVITLTGRIAEAVALYKKHRRTNITISDTFDPHNVWDNIASFPICKN